ncbi:MAG: hypothetical protein WBA41_29845 [Rivularia sp. (in: cyanobacteria)]
MDLIQNTSSLSKVKDEAITFCHELSETIYQLADEKFIKLEKRREIGG